MSTRSTIAIFENNKYKSIYCHYDGDNKPGGVGHTLMTSYSSFESAKRIINLGDSSSIEHNTIISYHRDKGSRWSQCKPKFSDTKIQLFKLANNQDADYLYIFENNRWLAYKNHHGDYIAL